MRTYPNFETEQEEIARLKAEPWQLDLLRLNPDYVFWGNFEDYMSTKEGQWSSAVEVVSCDELWGVDELNELVNFYFEVHREGHDCPICEGSDLNAATKKLSDDWYSFDNQEFVYDRPNHRYNNNAWSHHLTEVEVEALVKHGRLSDLMPNQLWTRFDEEDNKWKCLDTSLPYDERQWVDCEKPVMPTPEAVNAWSIKGFGHDAINQWICVEARAKHLGIYGHCEHCDGGTVFDCDKATVSLQLWYIHPRKGSSRGLYVKEVKQEDLPAIYKLLREADERNRERFSKIPKE